MKLTLPKDVLGSFPAPDSQGLVRVKAGLKVDAESGSVEIVELNGQAVSEGTDDDNPMPSESLPDLDQAEKDIYA